MPKKARKRASIFPVTLHLSGPYCKRIKGKLQIMSQPPLMVRLILGGAMNGLMAKRLQAWVDEAKGDTPRPICPHCRGPLRQNGRFPGRVSAVKRHRHDAEGLSCHFRDARRFHLSVSDDLLTRTRETRPIREKAPITRC